MRALLLALMLTIAGNALAAPAQEKRAYAKLLRQQDLVDLDELITLPVGLLRDDPALVERYRRQWQWIFVDEYQDVDEVQYELLRLLSPADGNLCAIGDPDQAIYSFRGADVKYFSNLSGRSLKSSASGGGSPFRVILGHGPVEYSRFSSSHFSASDSVSGRIASTGHSGSQTPQSMHSSGLITSMLSPS